MGISSVNLIRYLDTSYVGPEVDKKQQSPKLSLVNVL